MIKNKTLEQLIKKRQQEAMDKQIFAMGLLIAETLGKYKSGDYTYQINDTLIKREPCFLHIFFGEKQVFKASSGLQILGYVPGNWELALEKLYPKAKKIKDERAEKARLADLDRIAQAEKDLRDKWGL
jgi:hypothetical protein